MIERDRGREVPRRPAKSVAARQQLIMIVTPTLRVFWDDQLGSGTFGTVFKGELSLDKRECAVKIMDLRALKDHNSYCTEAIAAIIMKEHKHPRILTYYGIARNEETGAQQIEFALVMELASSNLQKLLDDSLTPLDEGTAKRLTCQVLEGLDFLHNEMRIFHRDIKPANILMFGDTKYPETCNVKIADFGISRFGVNEIADDRAGTLFYMAPEVFRDPYWFKADVYSVACMLIYMLLKEPIFLTSYEYVDSESFKMRMKEKSIRLILPSSVTPTMKEFLQCMTKLDQHERASVQELLRHEALQGVVDTALISSRSSSPAASAPSSPDSSSPSSPSRGPNEQVLSYIEIEGGDRRQFLTRVECEGDDNAYLLRIFTLTGWHGERQVARVSHDCRNNRRKFAAFNEAVNAEGYRLTHEQAEYIKQQLGGALGWELTAPSSCTNAPLRTIQEAVTSPKVAEAAQKIKDVLEDVGVEAVQTIKDAVKTLDNAKVADKIHDAKDKVADKLHGAASDVATAFRKLNWFG